MRARVARANVIGPEGGLSIYTKLIKEPNMYASKHEVIRYST